ncbi:hypothetical protein [Paraburkholderia sp. Ac-20347]|uniref:hypothetical protein n=1 Tax=Paraburkholderia sp. Ac-20347 TaxID=2703892 RepID=UPI00197FFB79|nr:hypothetical protein [Paraburkholderia sp. Ac-20347]MBN3808762.1 hypothetical protein [Paraburkholderia sp. Ac-20347]
MNKEEAIQRVQAVWDRSPAALLCVAIVDQLAAGVLHRLTFGQLYRLASKNEASQDDIARALQYLTGHDLHLLDTEFEFIDENDETFYFALHDLRVAEREGALYHPESGELIDNYEERVFPTFVPSSLAKEILAE